jgi:site-specific recombinase XerD
MLGHSNINTTQIYAKMLSKEVEDAYDTVASVWDKMDT